MLKPSTTLSTLLTTLVLSSISSATSSPETNIQVVTITSTLAASTITLAADTTSTPTSNQYPSPQSSDFQSQILNSTNYFRYLYPAPYLTYNATLASFAQSYSQKCHWQHNPAIGTFNYGENLARGYPDLPSAIDAWGNEVTHFDFSSSDYTGFSEETGHFTQLVWRSTQSVGCGYTNCNGKNDLDGVLLVCNYYPAGNIMAPSSDGGDENMFFKQNVVPERKGGAEGFDADDASRVWGPSGTATESVAGTVTASAGALRMGGKEGLRLGGVVGSLLVVGLGVGLGMVVF